MTRARLFFSSCASYAVGGNRFFDDETFAGQLSVTACAQTRARLAVGLDGTRQGASTVTTRWTRAASSASRPGAPWTGPDGRTCCRYCCGASYLCLRTTELEGFETFCDAA